MLRRWVKRVLRQAPSLSWVNRQTTIFMTFLEYLKEKKGIEVDRLDIMALMDEYYEEYRQYLSGVKDGCSEDHKS